MGFIIGLLTFVMVVDCLVLILLVLIQLPKKEAGAGLAFGGAATDALFGAGKGNVLTQITKYAAGTFFILALLLGIMQSRHSGRSASEFEKKLAEPGRPPASSTAAAPAPATPNPGVSLTSTGLLSTGAESTNLPAGATNAAPPK
jgi:protein translocase SecG subunit